MKTINLTKEDCDKILFESAKFDPKSLGNNDEISGFKLSAITEVSGFLGSHYYLRIWTKKNHQYNFFIKTLPDSLPDHTRYVQELNVFEKELQIYKTLFPELNKYSTRKWAPNFIWSQSNYFVLEDLSVDGFSLTQKPCEFQKLETVIAGLKTLAHFHASSLIYENITQEKIHEKYSSILYEICFPSQKGHIREKWARCNGMATLAIMKLLPTYREEFEDKWWKAISLMPELIKPSKVFPNVISHGDIWINNMMFRTKTPNEIETVLFDFQFVRYACPAVDFLEFIYHNCSEETIDEYFSDFIETYHSTMAQDLKKFNLNIDLIFPRISLVEACVVYRTPVLVNAAIQSMIIFFSDDFNTNLLSDSETFYNFTCVNKTEVVVKAYHSDKMFQNRVKNILNQVVRNVLSPSNILLEHF